MAGAAPGPAPRRPPPGGMLRLGMSISIRSLSRPGRLCLPSAASGKQEMAEVSGPDEGTGGSPGSALAPVRRQDWSEGSLDCGRHPSLASLIPIDRCVLGDPRREELMSTRSSPFEVGEPE